VHYLFFDQLLRTGEGVVDANQWSIIEEIVTPGLQACCSHQRALTHGKLNLKRLPTSTRGSVKIIASESTFNPIKSIGVVMSEKGS
jgi:hypothetical protein